MSWRHSEPRVQVSAEEVNSTFNLLPVVQIDTKIEKSGAWHIGACPFCGGDDRFNLRETNNGWRWFCRKCGDGKYHTAIDYFMRRDEVDFKTAIQNMASGFNSVLSPHTIKTELKTEPEPVYIPPLVWQARGREYTEACRQNLWQPSGSKALEWLKARGFSDLTLTKYQIGYNPVDHFEDLEKWEIEGDGQVWLARGITIPVYGSGTLYYIKTRRPIPSDSKDKKYVKVRGSKPGLFGWDNMRGAYLAVVTEGEFDAMILDQEAGDLAAVCTFGSATDSPLAVDPELLRWHYTATYTGLAFDNDEQGRNGALSFQEKMPNTLIFTLPDGYKDLNEMHSRAEDLGNWLCREVERLELALSFPEDGRL